MQTEETTILQIRVAAKRHVSIREKRTTFINNLKLDFTNRTDYITKSEFKITTI